MDCSGPINYVSKVQFSRPPADGIWMQLSDTQHLGPPPPWMRSALKGQHWFQGNSDGKYKPRSCLTGCVSRQWHHWMCKSVFGLLHFKMI